MEYLERELRIAVASLPPLVRRAMSVALASGWYSIEPGDYESATGVCPIVAAAKTAGFWRDGHSADGGAEWGTETEPSPPCFEFAVCFDMYAEVAGTSRAVEVVLEHLESETVRLAA